MELDGYTAADITDLHEKYFNLPAVPLQNVLIDGFSGSRGPEADPGEVTSDIQLAIAMAPGMSKVPVIP